MTPPRSTAWPARLQAWVHATIAAVSRAVRPRPRRAPSELERARDLIAAVDRGGIPLNPARVNAIARSLGLEVSARAPVEETIARIRKALRNLPA